MMVPTRQIRASYNDDTIRVYQAYSSTIANSALLRGTFISPPFKMARMTWIKPSFLWMMYRSGWGEKDSGQNRILAIDISRSGFEWALQHSLLSHPSGEQFDKDTWLEIKKTTPVRIQWDPERNLHLEPQAHRAIQIGLSNEAVSLYVNEWIQQITDITDFSQKIYQLVKSGDLKTANSRIPLEKEYPVNDLLKVKLKM
ncbi:DUF4291 domain-containing protein [Microbulbifer sp. OS29]|uniref:DUF4291 domain-containing protein n=1 Tax=Microbulbifer okhotskensis TaxID=2926617 RepID=A0A9X2EWE7_9GAMM|nr:DUF4291 domain-containing protein [Microbulbifer okhotskensis]MCO1336678.1 DUF4291 domain-containing protein [Microbulbifer okhotskensis]